MQKIEKYDFIELCLEAEGCSEPQVEFANGDNTYKIKGFRDGNNFLVRFMPQAEGIWRYSGDMFGEFLCVPNAGNNHGPVKADVFHFKYADGTRCFPIGTTCYAWIHQTPELIAQTLETLAKAPFNKLRMCVFPKAMPFNKNEPVLYPFHKREDGSWDVNNPDSKFWCLLEDNIGKLRDMGIEADLILFHPYDRWGFSKFSREENLVYLDYCICRLSAYCNIWWSLANEYDLIPTKTHEDWDAFGEKTAADDPYGHLLSNHNCFAAYPQRDWMTHSSIQRRDVKGAVIHYRNERGIPVIIDEFGYEGDIEYGWGSLSAFEVVNCFWLCNTLGGYCTHGETFYREDEVLWWAKGGKLHGESVKRIAYMRDVMSGLGNLDPMGGTAFFDPNNHDIKPEHEVFIRAIMAMPESERSQMILSFSPNAGSNDDYMLKYFARSCPSYADINLPENGKYRVEVIDVWEMTRSTVSERVCGNVRINLPGKEGIAVLASRLDGEN